VPFAFYLTIGFVFGLVAAAMAFLTTYGEYSRNRFTAKRLVWRMSLEIAFVVLAFFIIIAIVIALVMSKD